MRQIKICPQCETEYFPKIQQCADCGADLLWPDKFKSVQEERKRLMDTVLENKVVVREGDKKWIGELYDVLIDSGIPCVITADAGCSKGCSHDTRKLLVTTHDAERANVRIEEYFAEVHPEILVSKEMESQGKCPACGSPVDPGTIECTDCGLTLFIVEE